jgi:GntR family transcriptional regulator/MocR family aminotransferase
MLIKLEGAGPLYQRLYRAIRNQIIEGRLRAGERLPSTRTLARELGVSRNVVMLAFEQLVADGHLMGRTGSGTYVSSELPENLRWKSSRNVLPSRWGPARAAPHLSSYGRRLTDSNMRVPRTEHQNLPYDFRRHVNSETLPETWRRLFSGRARGARVASLVSGPPQGHQQLREVLSRYLGRHRGVVCDPNQILITSGSQQAFDLIARVLTDPGDRVVLEDPHSTGADTVFRPTAPTSRVCR